MNRTEVLTALFDTYGDDAPGALDAMANVDPTAWSEFMDDAALRVYRAEYRSWVRRQLREVHKETAPRLFDVAEVKRLRIRDRIVVLESGRRVEHRLVELAGADGVAVLRKAATRDERGARTTLSRISVLKKLADEIERRSIAEGRDVSVAEVLAVAA